MNFVKAWIWQFRTHFQFYTTSLGGEEEVLAVSQEQIKSVNITLLACLPRALELSPALVKPVPGYITQQPAELLRDSITGFTPTSPTTSTLLVNTALGHSSRKALNPGKTYRSCTKILGF